MQTVCGERPLLMGRQKPHRRPGETDLECEKQCGTVRQGQVYQGIRLSPAVLQVQQGQKSIQE